MAFQQCQNPDAEGTDEEPRSVLPVPAAAGAPPWLALFTAAWFALQAEATVLGSLGDSAEQDRHCFLGRGHWGAKNTSNLPNILCLVVQAGLGPCLV